MLYFFSREVAFYSDAITNVNASILNIDQDNDDDSINGIELEGKRAIANRVTGNEEAEFDFSAGWSRISKIVSPEDDHSAVDGLPSSNTKNAIVSLSGASTQHVNLDT